MTEIIFSANIAYKLNILKSMNKIVLTEGTSQRAGGGGKPVWRVVRNGFGRCADEPSSLRRDLTLQGKNILI